MKIIITCCLTILCSTALAQLTVDNNISFTTRSKLTQKSIEELKALKTYFVISDWENEEEFKKAVKKAWTITPYDFITYDRFKKLFDSVGFNANYFRMYGQATTHSFMRQYETNGPKTEVMRSVILQGWLRLSSWSHQKDGLTDLARIELSPNSEMLDKWMGQDKARRSKGTPTVDNLTPGMFFVYIKLVNDYLERGEVRRLYDKIRDNDELEKLKKDTLYVPDYVVKHFDKFNGNMTDRDEKELFSGYPYAYKILSREAISHMIMNATKPLYVFDYVRSSSQKYLSVYNAFKPKIIYSRSQSVSYNLKAKDISEIF